MQFLYQLQHNRFNYVHLLKTYRCNYIVIENGIALPAINIISRNLHSTKILEKQLNASANSVRYLQTFGNDNVEGTGFKSKLLHLLRQQTTQYALWFLGCMVLVFATAAISQDNRYRSSAKKSGHTSVMDADQLEVGS